jgi:hypothetical protein
VREGTFSDFILREWRGERLISIDPWEASPAEEYVSNDNLPQRVHDENYATTRRRLAAYGDRSSVWRTSSEEGSARISPYSLDMVYLDARHDYASVKQDLALWYPLIRPGGILAGHDYRDGEFPEGAFGVKSAVDDFCAEHDCQVHTTFGEIWPTWLIEVQA